MGKWIRGFSGALLVAGSLFVESSQPKTPQCSMEYREFVRDKPVTNDILTAFEQYALPVANTPHKDSESLAIEYRHTLDSLVDALADHTPNAKEDSVLRARVNASGQRFISHLARLFNTTVPQVTYVTDPNEFFADYSVYHSSAVDSLIGLSRILGGTHVAYTNYRQLSWGLNPFTPQLTIYFNTTVPYSTSEENVAHELVHALYFARPNTPLNPDCEGSQRNCNLSREGVAKYLAAHYAKTVLFSSITGKDADNLTVSQSLGDIKSALARGLDEFEYEIVAKYKYTTVLVAAAVEQYGVQEGIRKISALPPCGPTPLTGQPR